MFKEVIIVPSISEWCSLIVPVKKKEGLCRGYRWLNSVSESDAYPMPPVDDLIDQLGASYITTMDLTHGYWQVPASEDAKKKDDICDTLWTLDSGHRPPFRDWLTELSEV